MDTYRVRETATSAALHYRWLRSLFTEAERARVYGSRDPVCRFDLNEREAIYRLFGRKYDSLGSLLDRITGESGDGDPVDTYVMVLCARQLLKEPGRDYPEFWSANKDQLRILDHDFHLRAQ